MKPVRIIKTFADLRDAIAEVAATAPPANPPMSAQQVRDAARMFAAHRQREAARVVRSRSKSDVARAT
jgi:hypothetical protein